MSNNNSNNRGGRGSRNRGGCGNNSRNDQRNSNKKYVPIYAGTLNKESFLVTVEKFSVLIESYPLMQDTARINSMINSFRNCI